MRKQGDTKFHRAMNWMRKPGARLVLTNANGKPDYWIVGGGRIEPDIAKRIIVHPGVRAGKDALFPGLDQTWRLGAA